MMLIGYMWSTFIASRCGFIVVYILTKDDFIFSLSTYGTDVRNVREFVVLSGAMNVVLTVAADHGAKSLVNVKPLCIGASGSKGRSKHCHGSNADNTIVQVSVPL